MKPSRDRNRRREECVAHDVSLLEGADLGGLDKGVAVGPVSSLVLSGKKVRFFMEHCLGMGHSTVPEVVVTATEVPIRQCLTPKKSRVAGQGGIPAKGILTGRFDAADLYRLNYGRASECPLKQADELSGPT